MERLCLVLSNLHRARKKISGREMRVIITRFLILIISRSAAVEGDKMVESSAHLQEAAMVSVENGETTQHQESHFQEDKREVSLQDNTAVEQENSAAAVDTTEEQVEMEEEKKVDVEDDKISVEEEKATVEEEKAVVEEEKEKVKESSSSSSSSSDEEEKRSIAEVEELLPPPPQEDFPPPPAEMMNSVEDLPPPIFDLPSPSDELLPPPTVPDFEDQQGSKENGKEKNDDVTEVTDAPDSNGDVKEDNNDEKGSEVKSSYVALVSPTGFVPSSFGDSDNDKTNDSTNR